MKTLKKYKATIFGESYSLVSDEAEEHVHAAIEQVDELMRQVASVSGLSDPKRIAVLVAVQFAHQVRQCEEQVARCRLKESEIIELIDRELASVRSL